MIKVLTLLKALSPKELKLFRQFVESPFFNKRSDVVKLMDYWEKNYRNFSKEMAYESIFSDKKFNTQNCCLLYTSPSPRDRTRSRMPSSA